MALTNEEREAKITEGVLLLERWTLLWDKVAETNKIVSALQTEEDYNDLSNEDSPKKGDFILCASDSLAYIRSLES